MNRPGWVPTLAAAAGLVLTVSAANWQLNRVAYKQALAAQYAQRQTAAVIVVGQDPEPEDIRYRRVSASGRFDPARAVFIDNRIRGGRAGFEVVMPLRLADESGYALVNRGWVAQGRDRSALPDVPTPSDVVKVIGTAIVPNEQVYELSDQVTDGRTWQNLGLARYRKAYRIDMKDFVIQQENDLDDGLDRNWPTPGFGIEKNKSYVGQWLIFATLIVIFYVYFGFVRKRPPARD